MKIVLFFVCFWCFFASTEGYKCYNTTLTDQTTDDCKYCGFHSYSKGCGISPPPETTRFCLNEAILTYSNDPSSQALPIMNFTDLNKCFASISKSCTQLLMICTGDDCNFDCSSPLPLLCTTSTTSPPTSTSPSSPTDTPTSSSTMIHYNLALITFCTVLFKIKSLINI